MSDVSGVAASLVNYDEIDDQEDDVEGLDAFSHDGDEAANEAEFIGVSKVGGQPHIDGDDSGHDHAALLSDQGTTVFNYSMRDRMDGDGGNVNSTGYRNFNPVNPAELDTAEQRRKDADEYLFIALEQYEAARRLAELEAQIHAVKIKIEGLETFLDLSDDSDLNDDTLNGLAKRNRLRDAMIKADMNPDDFMDENGKFDMDKLERERERARQTLRIEQDRLHDLNLRHMRELENNPELRDLVQRRDAGDPQAQEQFRRMTESPSGYTNAYHAVVTSTSGLDTDGKVAALVEAGPEGFKNKTDAAVVLASSDGTPQTAGMSWDNFAQLDGVSSKLPDPAPIQTAEVLPETLQDLVEPVRAFVPDFPSVPDIKLIDAVHQVSGSAANAEAGPRSLGSVAAELGVDNVSASIEPITSKFADAANAQQQQTQVAALEAEAGLVATQERRTVASTAQFGNSTGMA